MNIDAAAQSQQSQRFDRFRAGFPALKQQTYLSICEKTILHDDVRAGIDAFLDHLALASTGRSGHERKVSDARGKFARMMNVEAPAVAAVRNVSDGINAVAWAMPMDEGDNVVVSAGAEHPNNLYPWLRLGRRGNEIRFVQPRRNGALDIDAMIDAIDGRTRIVSCASVTFAPGHRTDIARLAEVCRKRDVFLLVDGVQSAGILAHDLVAEQVDGFATSTSKGLLGLYGFGFLYVSPTWIDRLEPAYLSRPAVAMQTDDHSAMGGYDYRLQPDSRRFELGSYNLAGAYAADAALDLLLDLGIEAIEQRVLSLAGALTEAIAGLGLAAGVPSRGPGRSPIVTFGTLDAGGHDFSTDLKICAVSAALTEAKVAHTIRRGQLRFSVHGFNNEGDIRRAADCVADAMKAR